MEPDKFWSDQWIVKKTIDRLPHVLTQRLKRVGFGMDAHAECRGVVTTVGLILPNFKYDLAHGPRIGGGSPASKSGPVSSHAIKFVAECLE